MFCEMPCVQPATIYRSIGTMTFGLSSATSSQRRAVAAIPSFGFDVFQQLDGSKRRHSVNRAT